METFLLIELENLEHRLQDFGNHPEYKQEIDQIRFEIQGIGVASFSAGPMAPLVYSTNRVKQRIEKL